MIYWHTNMNPESRFLKEIDSSLIEGIKEEKCFQTQFDKEEMYNESDTEYHNGDIVMHTIYGRGVVVSVDTSIVTIAFSKQYGIRKLMKNHKSLRKIG